MHILYSASSSKYIIEIVFNFGIIYKTITLARMLVLFACQSLKATHSTGLIVSIDPLCTKLYKADF